MNFDFCSTLRDVASPPRAQDAASPLARDATPPFAPSHDLHTVQVPRFDAPLADRQTHMYWSMGLQRQGEAQRHKEPTQHRERVACEAS